MTQQVDRTLAQPDINLWKFNVIRTADSTSSYDVYFDWKHTQRRVCTNVAAKNEDEAIAAVLTTSNYLAASRFVESLGDFE